MIDTKKLECKDRYCKTNYPESGVLCRSCLNAILKSMTQEELLDVYHAIDILLYTSPKEKKLMNRVFGPEPAEILEEAKARWFDYFNGLLLSHGGRKGM